MSLEDQLTKFAEGDSLVVLRAKDMALIQTLVSELGSAGLMRALLSSGMKVLPLNLNDE